MTRRSNLIFDVGLHRAEDTRFYLAKGFDVVAVEAMPALAQRAGEELREYVDSGQLVIENVAIAETAGEIAFYTNPASEWGTIRPDWAQRNDKLGSPSATTLTVTALPFEDLLARHGVPHYLKIDIEGADLLCLRALDRAELPDYVSVESEKVSWQALVAEFDLLEELGYREFKLLGQHRVPRQRPPQPAREGRYVAWTFGLGASGLFGKEAPGRWLSRRAALAAYRLVFARYKLYGDAGLLPRQGPGRFVRLPLRALGGSAGWYDTHARR